MTINKDKHTHTHIFIQQHTWIYRYRYRHYFGHRNAITHYGPYNEIQTEKKTNLICY